MIVWGMQIVYEFDLPINNPPNLMVKVRGKVLDSNSNIPLGADIVFERLSDGTIVARTKSGPVTGEYEDDHFLLVKSIYIEL